MLGELRAGAHTAPHQRQQPSGAAADKKADFKDIKWSESEKETCWIEKINKKKLPKKKKKRERKTLRPGQLGTPYSRLLSYASAAQGPGWRTAPLRCGPRGGGSHAVRSPSRIQFHRRMKSGCSHRLDPATTADRGGLGEGVIRDAE